MTNLLLQNLNPALQSKNLTPIEKELHPNRVGIKNMNPKETKEEIPMERKFAASIYETRKRIKSNLLQYFVFR